LFPWQQLPCFLSPPKCSQTAFSFLTCSSPATTTTREECGIYNTQRECAQHKLFVGFLRGQRARAIVCPCEPNTRPAKGDCHLPSCQSYTRYVSLSHAQRNKSIFAQSLYLSTFFSIFYFHVLLFRRVSKR
jgi:hypothetical protein